MNVSRSDLAVATAAFGLAFLAASPVPPSPGTASVTLGWTREPNFDPPTFTTAADHELGRLLYEPLFDVDSSGRLVPRLAETVPAETNGGISADGLAIRYRLRGGVLFQDGQAVEAADVIATLGEAERAGASIGEIIQDVRADGQRGIVIRLKRRSASFIDSFFTATGMVSGVFERGSRKPNEQGFPVGSGPFRLTSYKRGDEATLTQNPRYYRGAPRIQTIRLKILPDANSLRNTLLTHEIDLANDLAPGAATAALFQRSDLHAVSAMLPGSVLVAYATWKAPFDDVLVRRGFDRAIDRRQIAEHTLLAQVTPATAYVPPGRWLDAPPREALSARAADSARSFDAAGWRLQPDGFRYKNGAKLAVTIALQPAFERVAVALQTMFRAAGADVTLHSYPLNLYYAQAEQGGIVRGGRFDLAIVADYSTFEPDVSGHLGCTSGKPMTSNVARFCDDAIDAAIDRVDATYDEKRRRELYGQLARLIDSAAPVSYLYHPVFISVGRKELRNVSADALGIFASSAAWHVQP